MIFIFCLLQSWTVHGHCNGQRRIKINRQMKAHSKYTVGKKEIVISLLSDRRKEKEREREREREKERERERKRER